MGAGYAIRECEAGSGLARREGEKKVGRGEAIDDASRGQDCRQHME